MEVDLEQGMKAAVNFSLASDDSSSDALVRKNSMRFRKKNDSILQETEIGGKAWTQGTSTGVLEIVVGESKESSSDSTIAIESPVKAKLEPSVYYDKVQGIWKCHHCSWVCPVLKPGVELIDNHKEHCQRMNNTRALERQGFPLEHEIRECSRANLYLVKGGGEIENENTDLLEDKTMPKILGKKTIIMTNNENQKWLCIDGDWQSNHMALEASTEAYISQSFVTKEEKREPETETGTNAFQDYTKKEFISFTSSQNSATAARENRGTITNGGQGAPENVGTQQHQHGKGLSESVLQNSQNAFTREKDGTQPRNQLEKSISPGNAEEEVVRVVNEQQSHDLLCPVCGSCITNRVILRKRKRTSAVLLNTWYQEESGDALVAASEEGLVQRSEDQNSQIEPQIEETETYGCLECLCYIIRRVTGIRYSSTKLESGDSSSATQSSSKMPQASGIGYSSTKFESGNSSSATQSSSKLPQAPVTGIGYSSTKLESGNSSSATQSSSKLPQAAGPEHVSVVKDSQMVNEKEAEASTSNVENGNDLDGTITPARTVSMRPAIHNKILQTEEDSRVPDTIPGPESILEAAENKISSPDRTDVVHEVEGIPTADGGASSNQLHHGPNSVFVVNIHQMGSKQETQVNVENGDELGATITWAQTVSTTPAIHDTIQQIKVVSEAPIGITGTESVLGDAEDKISSANGGAEGNLTADSGASNQLNSAYSSGKHDDAVEECFTKGNHGITHHSVNYKTSDISSTTATITSSMENISTEVTKVTQYPVGLHAPSQQKKQHSDKGDVERKKDKLPELPVFDITSPNIKQEQLTAEAFNGKEIQNKLGKHDELSNSFTTDTSSKLDKPSKGSYFRDCIPVSIQSILSKWPSKEIAKDGKLNEPLLRIDGDNLDQGASIVAEESSDHEVLPLDERYRRPELSDPHRDEKKVQVQSVHDESSSTSEVQGQSLLAPSEDHAGREPASVGRVQWDILKSIVYGGLNVSLTSFGVVSSAAGGEANTLTVIAIGLANMVAGLFMLFNSILNLQGQLADTIGHSLWFNGSVAVFSYIIFGSLAPITYGFSFQKSDDRNYKFFATSAVSLVSIILLAFGKARVSTTSPRPYFKTVSLYIISGFWACIIGYLAGEYITKLLEKWGLKTDNGDALKAFYC